MQQRRVTTAKSSVSHGIDEVRFYSRLRMYGLADGRKQIKIYNKKSDNISKSCLKYRIPNAVLQDYLDAMCQLFLAAQISLLSFQYLFFSFLPTHH